ncbi:sulfur transporter [Salsuginibacillus halophilus]|uniref:Sulfur transporter n=1 Tax=Salsuginibacillus halophilus TaxID=517424 RepID=A0A2P8HWK3_9BACI|nr:sulfur transporter [Salsuginibacillus halophilus]
MKTSASINEHTPSAQQITLPSTQSSLVGAGLITALILSAVTLMVADAVMLLLLWIGVMFGYTLFHARFGFTSAFRQFLAVGHGKGIRAHMVMLGAASTFFAPILALNLGAFGNDVSGYVSPVGIGMLFGAFIFGIGMQLGGG